MHKTIFIALLLAPLCVMAAIYKSIDSEGDVVFTDKPSPGAQEIPEPSPNTIKLPKGLPADEQKPDTVKNTVYTSLRITSPGANETIHSSPGLLSISLALTPGLNLKAGDGLNIMVDGYVLIKNSSQLNARIPDINRGSHRLQALVTSKQGVTLIKSNEVQFFMRRESQAGKSDDGGPKDASGKAFQPGPQDTGYRPGPKDTNFKPGPQIPPTEN